MSVCSEKSGVYQRPFSCALLPAVERWLSRMTRIPTSPRVWITRSMIVSESSPITSRFVGPAPLDAPMFVGRIGDETMPSENGMRTTL